MIRKGIVSVIVPVYKTEKFLAQCLDSICRQTYSGLEIILVDDGSPDNCPTICDEYAARDHRIKVIHKKNGGVSAARNKGLEEASGEYITFVDSDDWIEPEMYEKMMTIAMKYDCDVVMCDCRKESASVSNLYSQDIRSGYYDYRQLKDEYYGHLLMMENVEFPPTISNWLCMYRQNPEGELLRYKEGIRYSEDLLFGAQMMYQARSFYYMKGEALYHYRIREDSASHKYDMDAWEDHVMLCNAAKDYFQNKEEGLFVKQIDLMWLYFVYNTLGEMLCEPSLNRKEKIRIAKKILSTKEVYELFKRVEIRRLPISTKLKIRTYCYKYKIGINLLIK